MLTCAAQPERSAMNCDHPITSISPETQPLKFGSGGVPFFFGLCCARHNDSGSHEDMLNWSSVDNSIAQIGQWTKRKQKQNKQTAPTTKPKPTIADQSMKVRQVKHVYAFTTWCIAQKPRLSQHLQQLVECHTSNNWIPCGPQLPGRAQKVSPKHK